LGTVIVEEFSRVDYLREFVHLLASCGSILLVEQSSLEKVASGQYRQVVLYHLTFSITLFDILLI